MASARAVYRWLTVMSAPTTTNAARGQVIGGIVGTTTAVSYILFRANLHTDVARQQAERVRRELATHKMH